MQCRFCFEETSTPQNPLIEPCACRGSVQYIHTSCLRRWILQDPTQNTTHCSICHTPFTVAVLPRMEVVPCSRVATVNFLHNITAISLFVQYVFVIYELRSIGTFPVIERIKNAQIFIHSLYSLCFMASVSITNKKLYYRECFASGINVRLLLLHFCILWKFLLENDLIMGLSSTLILNIYWPLHVQTLRRVNQVLLEN